MKHVKEQRSVLGDMTKKCCDEAVTQLIPQKQPQNRVSRNEAVIFL